MCLHLESHPWGQTMTHTLTHTCSASQVLWLVLQELDLKTGPLAALLQPPKPLQDEPNINCLWARLLIDELCRQGVNTFCIAPGVWCHLHTSARSRLDGQFALQFCCKCCLTLII